VAEEEDGVAVGISISSIFFALQDVCNCIFH
jgi:hypothetical protein